MFIIVLRTSGTNGARLKESIKLALAGCMKKKHTAKAAQIKFGTRQKSRDKIDLDVVILSRDINYILNYITFIIICGIIKIMKWIKKFFMVWAAMLPMASWGVAPFVLGGAAVGVGIIGATIWRNIAPVDVAQALDFFTSCWTCQIFSDVMVVMSDLLPGVYRALGLVIIPMSVALLAMFIGWRLTSGFFNGKLEEADKMAGNFGAYMVRLVVVASVLLIPLPRLITNVLIEPALTIGTSIDYAVSQDNKFAECMIATSLADPAVVSADAANYGAFSPKLRHQLACEVANVHQVTGLGMTVGWTIMGMAFNSDYMHKILSNIPIFPNVPYFFLGLLIFVLYFYALLPIPLYFLEIFITLSMDLIMLPLMLMSWMFDDENFKLFPKGGKTIRQMIDDVIKAVIGIALTVIFLTFSIKFLNATFGSMESINILHETIINNDSTILMEGLVAQKTSLVTLILMGVFFAMFMTMIPQLTNMLFNIKISNKYYETAKNDLNTMWKNLKKWGEAIKK